MKRKIAKQAGSVFLLLLLAGLLFIAACGTQTEVPDTTESFYVFPSTLTLKVGEKRQFYFLNVAGGTISQVNATFSLYGSVGRISLAGLFSAEAVGEGTIYAIYTVTGTVESILLTVEAE